ncbi:MAG: aminopeptidase, partial [Paludibacteraceae bacterium]|nr:aminopeptidase [Paludibacteraceae bacterium]
MKRILLGLIGLIGLISPVCAEEQADSIEGWQFTTIDSVGITPVKDQNRSGTCWCFSTIGFLESEILRTKGIELDLSEMFIVNHNMLDRATYFVRQYGEGSQYAPGGSAYDVLYCMEHYGLVTQDAMPGIRYGDTLPNHTEVDAICKGFLGGITGGKVKKLSPVWREAFQAIWDTYLGKCPETFTYNGKTYTPLEFKEWLGLKESDYVSLTSYTHHPFYTRFALEVPDNWRMDQMYN